jgi:hypothetical protein
MKMKTGQIPTSLTSGFSVELPGIEPDALPGKTAADLQFHSVSFRFSPAHYLRIRFRVLTASRVIVGQLPVRGSTGHYCGRSADGCQYPVPLPYGSGSPGRRR